jgi:putative Mg2+ transporter-C (MgtC) family protein
MISEEILMIFKLIVSAILMFILGRERQKKRRFIGPRTLILIGCASTLFSSIGFKFQNFFIIGGLITGVGFIGGGLITKEKGKVAGLTTAALIWMASTIGTIVGLEFYLTAIFTTFFSFFVLKSKEFFNE